MVEKSIRGDHNVRYCGRHHAWKRLPRDIDHLYNYASSSKKASGSSSVDMLRTGKGTLAAEKLEAGCHTPKQGFLGHLIEETGSLPILRCSRTFGCSQSCAIAHKGEVLALLCTKGTTFVAAYNTSIGIHEMAVRGRQ